MNVSIIGTGYVGLVTGACFSDLGVNVLCMDTDESKINGLKKCNIPIYEPHLAEIIQSNYGITLNFTTDIKQAVEHADIIFIAVGTPTLEDNTADLSYVFQAIRNIAIHMETYKVIINKSTVPIGTGNKVRKEISKILRKAKKKIPFDIISNPEFLREGNAVKDFMQPERIVVGSENARATALLQQLYGSFISKGIPFIVTNLETAEMVKYASNAFLAAKISFINEIAALCEHCNADVSIVARAMGLDSRIGSQFLNPGPGFGGSCFPKDLKALLGIGRKIGYIPKIIKSVIAVNENQKKRAFNKISETVGSLKDKNISILGVAFKAETDDIRESPSVSLIKLLLQAEAKVRIYDPKALENFRTFNPSLGVVYTNDPYTACVKSDCIVIATEWKEFSSLDLLRLKQIVHVPLIIDLRNILEPEVVKESGFDYLGVGRK